jgi:thioredoxin-like negative regulator of GroEL
MLLSALLVYQPAWSVTSSPSPDGELAVLRTRWMRSPRDPQLAEALARQLFMEGRREEACHILLTAHSYARSAADRELLASRVRVLSRSFLSSDSTKIYQGALNALSLGRLSVSEERLAQVLAQEPAHFDALVRRGQVRWLSGNTDGAFEDWNRALGINPFVPELQAWLALAQFRRGEKAQGLIQAQSALGSLKSNPSEVRRAPFWRGFQAVVLWESGQKGAAQEKLLQLVRERPGLVWAWDYLLRDEPPSRSVLAQARVLTKTHSARSVDLDGPSGIFLEWWEPEGLKTRLSSIELPPESLVPSR